jgi:hypothetical protein
MGGWLAVLVACWEPTATGPGGMVGTLVDASGAPVAGQLVESLEAVATTGDDGRFALQYKEPNTEVHFQRAGNFYQRRWQAQDPPVVTVALPSLRAVAFACGPRRGDITLLWALGDGFAARRSIPCVPDATLALGEVPVGAPSATGRVDLGAPEEVLVLEDRGDLLRVVPPPRPIPARIQPRTTAPTACALWVDGAPVAWSGLAGTVPASGLVTVTGRCDDLPMRPVVLGAEAGEVALDWSANPPQAPLPSAIPAGSEVWLAARDAPWTIALDAGADGTIALPPLAPGRYRIAVAPASSRDAALAVAIANPPMGVVAWVEVDPQVWVGALELDAAVWTGRIPTRTVPLSSASR